MCGRPVVPTITLTAAPPTAAAAAPLRLFVCTGTLCSSSVVTTHDQFPGKQCVR